jgi:hypothetical protein
MSIPPTRSTRDLNDPSTMRALLHAPISSALSLEARRVRLGYQNLTRWDQPASRTARESRSATPSRSAHVASSARSSRAPWVRIMPSTSRH